MNIFLLSVLTIMYAQNNAYSAELSCSATKTVLFTVNGVLVNKDGAIKTSDRIGTLVKDYKKEIDKNGELEIKSIHNKSLTLPNDLLEGLAQELRSAYKIKNPWTYIYSAMTGTKVAALTGNPLVVSALATSATLSGLTMTATEAKLTDILLNNVDLQEADNSVVTQVREEVKQRLNLNQKVILIPHSQGNTVVNAAMEELKLNNRFINDYRPILGVLHIATPSSYRSISKSALIKINSDLVVNNPIIRSLSEPANYIQQGYEGNSFVDNVYDNFIKWFASGYDLSGHFMVESYLSDVKKVKKPYESISRSTATIFQENLINVAQQLEDNCLVPVIKISSDQVNGNSIIGLASTGNVLSLRIKDIAGDADGDGDDDNGYESDKTKFTYSLITSHSAFPTINGTVSNDGTVQFPVPYADLSYTITVTATSPSNKISTVSKSFHYTENAPLTAVVGGKACATDEYGDTTGVMNYTITTYDDQYLVNNKTRNGASWDRTIIESASDGMHSVNLTFSNICTRTVVGHNTYEVWSSCQTTYCNNVPPFDPNCTDQGRFNTGLQYNKLRIYFPNGIEAEPSMHLGDGLPNSPTAYFWDPNDPTKQVAYNPGGFCSPGARNESNGEWYYTQGF